MLPSAPPPPPPRHQRPGARLTFTMLPPAAVVSPAPQPLRSSAYGPTLLPTPFTSHATVAKRRSPPPPFFFERHDARDAACALPATARRHVRCAAGDAPRRRCHATPYVCRPAFYVPIPPQFGSSRREFEPPPLVSLRSVAQAASPCRRATRSANSATAAAAATALLR